MQVLPPGDAQRPREYSIASLPADGRVHLLVRRSDIPRINKGKGAGNAGMVHGFAQLSPEWKWQIRHYLGTQQVPSPRGSTLRVSQFSNAKFNLGCALEK